MHLKALLGGAGLAAALLLSSSLPALADHADACRIKIERAEARLDNAIDRYGRDSRRTRDARHDLENARDWCGHHDHSWLDTHVYHEHGDDMHGGGMHDGDHHDH